MIRLPHERLEETGADRSAVAAFALVGELGFVIAVPVFLLGFGGAHLDKALGTQPAFMLSGFALSFAVSTVAVVRLVKRLERFSELTEKKPDVPPR